VSSCFQIKIARKVWGMPLLVPVFVWIAVAIALLLIGGATAMSLVGGVFNDFLHSPLGYAIIIGIIMFVILMTWKNSKSNRSSDEVDK